jgi:signal transduction histidine kinase
MILGVGLDSGLLERLPLPVTPHELTPGQPLLPEGGEGWILLPEDADPALLQGMISAVLRCPRRWSLFLVLRGRGEVPRLAALSVGDPVPADFVAERLASAPAVFSLRHATHEIARIRHDLNNPLTAAMAETQLLRMDLDEEGLEVVETQLRRLRDLIAELVQWRLPR